MAELTEEDRRRLIASIPEAAIIDSSKENIKPRRQGRHAAALVIEEAERDEVMELKHVEFKNRLDNMDDLDDPLNVYVEYYTWTTEMYPYNDTRLLNLLKDATPQFVDDVRYKNDPRYLKLWIEYANLVKEPRDIYVYLVKKDIGQSLALFYEEYANYLEGIQKYDEAEEVYKRGIQQSAAPLRRLEKNYDIFKQRMEARREQGILRRHRQEARLQMEALRATGQRTMLGEKFDSRSRVSMPSNIFSNIRPQQQASSSFGNQSIQQQQQQQPSSSFQVYTDNSSNNNSSSQPIASSSSSSHRHSAHIPLFSRSQRIENELVKEKFAGATLLQSSPVQPVVPIPKFEVYQDDDAEERTSERQNRAEHRPLLHASDGSESVLSRIRRHPTSPEIAHKSIKKSRLEDTVDERLIKRFHQNKDNYIQTKDSKDRKEYISVLKRFNSGFSFEEYRDIKGGKLSKKAPALKFEPLVKEEYTTETLAAIKSVDAIIYKSKTEDEEEVEQDLTWTNDIQKFAPVQRSFAREN
ncbi:hypothetical protein G6F70_006516 [Rhizopus microsporus]|nr:hypothetical protein G6F71_005803 [Rhizopus microsporus]KAG1197570.1 hypothetical protein G6F70_006516 [Rhizopus microsporus]KAG1210398.1 hypothetical protein G6F69_005508 [Rhizopus microsporus]KAG1231296.1 hypothetical protein G6F67_005858 [Rhizopus microsporus]KAG1265713.1 hypothetical protein G6F68_003364 [Rhizopus microsporus]